MYVEDWVDAPSAADPTVFTWRTHEEAGASDDTTIGTLVLDFGQKKTVYRPVLYADFRQLRTWAAADNSQAFSDGLAELTTSATSVRTVTTE